MNGIVKEYNKQKGFGFISGDDGEDYFLNIKNLRSGQSIKVGSQVKFDTEESNRGSQAVNVTLH